ncbi:MAG TPA: Ldh family oxidoreductase [Spirochaetia bacterium]|jgi:LDH2 family malate/lactate/ureidoglycolate dehydrogenase|nr:Ldh family oxidoreductase [Spirochaetia bacterium]
MILTPAQLESWTFRLLLASGLSETHAARTAEVYRRASARGLGHHDLSALPQRLGWLAQAEVNPRPRVELTAEGPAFETWDGDEGLGEVLCRHILDRALEKARSTGVAYAGVRRSNHFLAADPYVQMGAEAGFLVVLWSNTDAGMAFPGGTRKVLGNNPLGWALGSGEGGLSADLCLAETSIGNLNALAAQGAPVPPHWGRGPDGRPATTAQELQKGAIEPIGGPKGLALALLGEVLTGVLTGGPTFDQVLPPAGLRTHNQMVLAFDLSYFGGTGMIGDRITSLRTRARAAGLDRFPGDRSHAAEDRAQAGGILVPEALVASLGDWSGRLGVEIPSGSS